MLKYLPLLNNSTYFQFVQLIFMIQNSSGSCQYGATAYLKLNTKYVHLNGVEK